MTHKRLATAGLVAVMLVVAAPALAGHGRPASLSENTLRLEQVGPKQLHGAGGTRTRSTSSRASIIPITLRTLRIEELGPKYLLH